MKVQINERVFNQVYLSALHNQKEITVFYGGSASGKSYFITQKIIKEVLQGGRNYLVIRKVAKTIRNSVYAMLKKIISEWNLTELFSINKTEFSFTCINGYKILCQGLDDPEKIKSITVEKGQITDIWIEEATELLEEDLNQLILRMRGKTSGQKNIVLSFNPISETHWLKKRFYDNPGQNIQIIKTTYKDNLRFLSEQDIRNIESMRDNDPLYYQVYALGEWGQLNYNDTVFKLGDVLGMFTQRFTQSTDYMVCGVDPARMGDDSTVFYLRNGNIVLKKLKLKKMDNIKVCNELEQFIEQNKNCQLNIDAGMGAGIIDTMRSRGYNVQEINFGGAAENKKYGNTITEMWFETKERMSEIQVNFEDKELKDELLSRKYRFDEIKGKINIEKKDEFKKRFGRSPDSADAFLICFYQGGNVNADNIMAWDAENKVRF